MESVGGGHGSCDVYTPTEMIKFIRKVVVPPFTMPCGFSTAKGHPRDTVSFAEPVERKFQRARQVYGVHLVLQ